MRARRSVGQRGALSDAEFVLFVDNHEGQPRDTHCVLQQRVRADDDVDLTIREHGLDAGLDRSPQASREQRDRYRLVAFAAPVSPDDVLGVVLHRGCVQLTSRAQEVLFRQHLGRRHEGADSAVCGGGEQSGERHYGLPATYFTLKHSAHRYGRGDVLKNGFQSRFLIAGQFEFEAVHVVQGSILAAFDRHTASPGRPFPLPSQHGHLVDKELVERHPLSRQFVFVCVLGEVHAAEGVGEFRHSSVSQYLLRNVVRQ